MKPVLRKLSLFGKKGKLVLIVLLVSVFLISFVITAAVKYSFSEKTQSLRDQVNISEEHNYWLSRIKETGGEKAYQEFKDKYLAEYPVNVHYIAHIFGQALYESEGDLAVAVCDSNFAYGCYHAVIVSALKKNGLEVITSLNDSCVRKNGPEETGCRHGIGHGLLEYLGRNQLKKALEVCSSIQRITPLGCTQGVFMEYNNPGMMDSNSQFLGLRKLKSEEEMQEPCLSLSNKFLTSCYYEQSQWWVNVLDGDYQRIGLLCQELGQPEVRKSCFLGVGVIAGQKTRYDVGKTVEACIRMPGIENQLDCRSGAGWVFKVNPNYKHLSSQVCKNLSEENFRTCIQNSISPYQLVN